MERIFLIFSVLSLCNIPVFAADDHKTYKTAFKIWGGENPLANKLREKIKEETLDTNDLREILQKGSFPYSAKSVHGLTPVSEGKTTQQVLYKADFVAESFLITYLSRSLGPRIEIPQNATIEFIKVQKLDPSSREYEYRLILADDEVYNFSLKYQKLIKKSEEKLNKHRHQQALRDATRFRRPGSIYMDALPQDLEPEHAKEQRLRAYIEKSRTDRKDEEEITQLTESDGENSSSGTSEKSETDRELLFTKVKKEVSRQRSFSDLSSKTVKTGSSGTGTKTLKGEILKASEATSVSFALPDLTSSYTKKEAKRVKQTNKRSAFAESRSASAPRLDAKKIAKEAKKVKKEQEKKDKKKK